MRRYRCPTCGHEIYFANDTCLSCGAELVYDPFADAFRLLAEAEPCRNRSAIGCNWSADEAGGFCHSCASTEVIPNAGFGDNAAHWARFERAKRQLYRTLLSLGLPTRAESEGLRFRFMADTIRPDGSLDRVVTGHQDGLVTLNIEEADDAVREANRKALDEPYRTLIGHLRHEVGHFYWDILVRDGGRTEEFRALFGDETEDYGASMRRHYEAPRGVAPPEGYVSHYATAHPWEDFAESWAHYLHLLNGLETAAAYGLSPLPFEGDAPQLPADPYSVAAFDALIGVWLPVTVAMNEMNRSIGNVDFYPFVLSDQVVEKLRFIHDLVRGAAEDD